MGLADIFNPFATVAADRQQLGPNGPPPGAPPPPGPAPSFDLDPMQPVVPTWKSLTSPIQQPGQDEEDELAGMSLPRPQTSFVPDQMLAKTDQTHIDAIRRAAGSEEQATKDLGEVEANRATQGGLDAAQSAQQLGQRRDEVLQRAQEQNAIIQAKQDKIDSLSNDVANKKIPDWWTTQSEGQKALYGIAAVLGGFMQGVRGGENTGMQAIERQRDLYLQEQKRQIEEKKGRIGDMKGLLAETYRQFGNMNEAYSVAHDLANQQLAAQFKSTAAQFDSPAAQHRAELAVAQLMGQHAKEDAGLFDFQRAHTVTTGGADPKKIHQDMMDLIKTGMDPREAERTALFANGALNPGSMGLASVRTPQERIALAKMEAEQNQPDEAPLVAPKSTAGILDSVAKYLPNTDARRAMHSQEAYNTELRARALARGASPRAVENMVKAFDAQGNAWQSDLDLQNREANRFFARHARLGGKGAAAGAGEEPEGTE